MARLITLAGCAGLFLLLAARGGGLPLRWSFSILAHAPLWGLASATLTVYGIWLMWTQTHPRAAWSPSVPGQRFTSLVVYTREVCPLCEKAMDVLARYRPWLPPPIEVDIDQDPDLRERFNESIPVVECDGKVRFRGILSEPMLRRLIEGTPPVS